jgi:hypothetical protein
MWFLARTRMDDFSTVMTVLLIVSIVFSILLLIAFIVGVSSMEKELRNGSDFKMLMQMIGNGEWVYSSSKLNLELRSYSTVNWVKNNRSFGILLLLFAIPTGLMFLFIFCVIMIIQNTQANKYEEHLVMLKKSALNQERSAFLEISRLFDLKEKGVISESEFNEMKAKIVQK